MKNLQFNKSKCVFSTRSIKLLGYLISDGEIRPDPDRMQPLKDLPAPNDSKHLQQVVGLFHITPNGLEISLQKLNLYLVTTNFLCHNLL